MCASATSTLSGRDRPRRTGAAQKFAGTRSGPGFLRYVPGGRCASIGLLGSHRGRNDRAGRSPGGPQGRAHWKAKAGFLEICITRRARGRHQRVREQDSPTSRRPAELGRSQRGPGGGKPVNIISHPQTPTAPSAHPRLRVTLATAARPAGRHIGAISRLGGAERGASATGSDQTWKALPTISEGDIGGGHQSSPRTELRPGRTYSRASGLTAPRAARCTCARIAGRARGADSGAGRWSRAWAIRWST